MVYRDGVGAHYKLDGPQAPGWFPLQAAPAPVPGAYAATVPPWRAARHAKGLGGGRGAALRIELRHVRKRTRCVYAGFHCCF